MVIASKLRQALKDDLTTSSMKSIDFEGGIVDSIKCTQCKKKDDGNNTLVKACEEMKFKNSRQRPLHRQRSGLRRGYPEEEKMKQANKDLVVSRGGTL